MSLNRNSPDTSLRRTARISGAIYFLIIVIALLTLVFVDSPLIVSGDTAATVSNIRANGFLYRVGIAGDLVMFVLVVLLSTALYVLLKSVDKNLALAALLLRFAEGIIGGVATLLGGIAPLLLLRGESTFVASQLHEFFQFYLDIEAAGLDVVLIFMGLGGTIFCYLFFKSKYVPRILAVWGMITYLSMLILSFANVLFPGIPEVVSNIIFAPGAVFELLFGLWLFFKGVKT